MTSRLSSRSRTASATNRSSLPSPNEIAVRSSAKPAGPTSAGRPATQTVRSLAAGASCTPATRFQASADPSAVVPTPADHDQAVSRAW